MDFLSGSSTRFVFQFDYLFVALEAWGAVFSLVAGTARFFNFGYKTRSERYMIMILFSSFLLMISDIVSWLLRGGNFGVSRDLMIIPLFLTYFFSYLISLLFVFYMFCYVERRGINMWFYWLVLILISFCVIMTFISLENGGMFYVDSYKMYQRGRYYNLTENLAIIVMVCVFVIIIMNRKILGRAHTRAFLLYIIFPGIGLLGESLIRVNVSLFNLGVEFAVLILYSTMISENQHTTLMQQKLIIIQKEQLMAQERQLGDMRLQIVFSQVQPHFLYNCLNSIYFLCEKDPQKAQEAISNFSDYLRMNMDALSSTESVPFKLELKHVGNYLQLEKMRYEDELNVEYDLAERDFVIPAITLQPIVENAVKHGISKSENGGNIKISTIRNDEAIEIYIEDDGVGFDVSALEQENTEDERSHIGIRNVRERLKVMCGGDMIIDSKPGVGTRVTIVLPVKDQKGRDIELYY